MSTVSLLRTPPRPAEPSAESPEALLAGLYERHADRILSYCRRRLPTTQQAEDAAQDTFVCAMRALQRGTVPVAEAAWLFKIAERVCFGVYRTNARRGECELSEPEEVADTKNGATGDALFGLGEALSSIPVNQRRAFVLRELRGLSYAEIAAALEVSVASVETLIYRARRGLARALQTGAGIRGRVATGLNLGPVLGVVRRWFREVSLAKVAAVTAVAAVAALPAAGVQPKPPLAPVARSHEPAASRTLITPAGAVDTSAPVSSSKRPDRSPATRSRTQGHAEAPSAAGRTEEPVTGAPGSVGAPAPDVPASTQPPRQLPVQAPVRIPELLVEVPQTPELPALPDLPEVPPAPPLPPLPVTAPDLGSLLPPPPKLP
jgi:RNA polymerase sigma factor (sigma-70 family)